MQATEQSPVVNLQETVKSLLDQKGNTVWTISPQASVYEAIESMSERQIGALVVLNGGRLEGIVTERDYARKVILKGRHSSDTRVGDIMSAPVISVTPEQTVGECMHLITSSRIRYLPVVEADRVIGLVSIGDLISWTIAAQDHTIRQLHNYITGSYPPQ